MGALDDTWEWDGETQSWQQVPVVFPAPRRANAVMTPDITGGLLIFGGTSPFLSTTKIFRLSSEQRSRQSSAASHLPRTPMGTASPAARIPTATRDALRCVRLERPASDRCAATVRARTPRTT